MRHVLASPPDCPHPPRRAALHLRNDVTYSIPTANLAALNSNIQSGSGTAGSVSGARRRGRTRGPTGPDRLPSD